MSTHRCSLVVPLLLLAACARTPAPVEHVVHEERALAKANAAWAAVYTKTADATFSADNVRRFAPYSATLEDGSWTVRTRAPADVHGMAPSASIRADDGTTSVRSVER